LYIDDRFAVSNPTLDGPGYKQSSACLTYVVLQVLTRLGYTLSLNKCSLYDIAALISLQNNLQPGTARDIEMHFPQNRCNVFRLTSSNDKIN
jgi:hypothetical protein